MGWRRCWRSRVYIPKPGRPKERRPLRIPPVRDRVVQTAARLVLEPIFEASFLPCSFGFRPKRRAHDALEVLRKELNNSAERGAVGRLASANLNSQVIKRRPWQVPHLWIFVRTLGTQFSNEPPRSG